MLARTSKIDGRHLGKLLAAVVRAEDEFDGRPPLPEILGQDLGAGHVALARRVGNGAVGAHEASEKILHLAFTCVALADADALSRGRLIDIEPRGDGELCHWIYFAGVESVSPAIVRHTKRLGIGDAASAHLFRGLEDDIPLACRAEPPRGRDAGGAGAHDDGIHPAGTRHLDYGRRARRPKGGPCRGRAGRGKKGAAAEMFHGVSAGVLRGLPRSA